MTERVVDCSGEGIRYAANTVMDGGTVVFPTDTVYGIGCDPFNAEAVAKVYHTKSREFSKPLPVLGGSLDQLKQVGVFNDISERLASFFWPGGLTMVVHLRDSSLKSSMRIPDDRIALRVPANRCCLELLKQCGLLVGTSANRSGMPSHTDPVILQKEFSDYDVFVDGGSIQSLGESTIVDTTSQSITILRKGVISSEKISSVL